MLMQEGGMKMRGESMKMKEPVPLVERRAFMKPPLTDRREIMVSQANEIADRYATNAARDDLETGDIVDD